MNYLASVAIRRTNWHGRRINGIYYAYERHIQYVSVGYERPNESLHIFRLHLFTPYSYIDCVFLFLFLLFFVSLSLSFSHERLLRNAVFRRKWLLLNRKPIWAKGICVRPCACSCCALRTYRDVVYRTGPCIQINFLFMLLPLFFDFMIFRFNYY